ncbi:CDGSH iron-sulfur domain-containing protein [Nocardioides rotundus]|uniref:CDGSH iron-sulfur domain-containing protein n=1 Tax=Nocardioides rotundus TaxID=1774216 RepID=UPI001CBDBE68|nr:CDGSH iron-sulfur domain-containing protein [Nocardioides rotundus]UAL30103.1 CDGSH iron-sulfur domain-containing protein [Nocardioides rotundus]
MTEREPEVVWEPCDDGPLLVRGARVWTDGDGVEHPVTRPVVAICRCGGSALQPWCDGSHKHLRRS